MVRALRPKDPWTYCYGAEALDGDIMQLSFEAPAPSVLEGFSPRKIFGGGARVSAENMPTRLKINGRKRRMLDFENQYHIFCVNKRFIEVVEDFQKDLQYFPLDCIWSDGSSAGSMFFLFTTVLIDSLDRDRTTVPWFAAPNGRGMWDLLEGRGKRFVFSTSKIENSHFWVDPYLPTLSPFVSDELYNALRTEKIECFYRNDRYEEF